MNPVDNGPILTLMSPEFRDWQRTAMESGMPEADIAAVTRIRLRLIAAVSLCEETVGTAPTDLVTQAFVEICRELDRGDPYQLTWPASA